jgi:hypothetical protein
MPVLKEVDVRIWCPGPWPWEWVDTCVRKRHRWCYAFDWLQTTGYVFLTHYEGCEHGRLYTWNEAFGGIGSSYAANVEVCREDKLADEGRCDASNIGIQTGGLSKSAPFVRNLAIETVGLASSVAGRGTFVFTPENSGLCRQGAWDWRRTLHEQRTTMSVDTRFATVEWRVGGMPLATPGGTVSFSTFCTHPFPLPAGLGQNRVVHVRYEVSADAHESTVKLFNDPADGNYAFPIELRGLDADTGKQFTQEFTSWNFKGETCDFDPARMQDMLHCLTERLNLIREKAQGQPGPIDPGIRFADDIWRFVPDAERELARYLLEIMQLSFQTDQETFTMAADQFEAIAGLPGGVDRFMQAAGERAATGMALDRADRADRDASKIVLLATGLLLGAGIALLARRSRGR